MENNIGNSKESNKKMFAGPVISFGLINTILKEIFKTMAARILYK